MNYGPHASEGESHAQMDKALDLGFNFFDTADVYGWKKGEGITEKIIGTWFAQGGGRREKVILATKVYGDMELDPADHTMKKGLSAIKIRRACENSLKRMKTDYIDLYQMHHIYVHTPWEEIWQAYEILVQQGKVVYAGSSNFGGWHIATAQAAAKERPFMGLVCEQSKYSLLCRNVEQEVLPACRHYGLGVIPWSPLDGGILGGALANFTEGRRAGEGAKKRIEQVRPQLEKWEGFCRERGEKPADVALAWLLHNPAVTAPIIGPRTMQQLTDSLRCLEIQLDENAMKTLDRIFPGTAGPKEEGQGTADWKKYEAPLAYAW
jgi:aryl-alcohol dehydrogenase-like predicted oxidoreductase